MIFKKSKWIFVSNLGHFIQIDTLIFGLLLGCIKYPKLLVKNVHYDFHLLYFVSQRRAQGGARITIVVGDKSWGTEPAGTFL